MNEVFTRELRLWGAENRRNLPWVGQRDPYRIWLSEVILQQTRVEQGLPYYRRFLELFPRVEDLAMAPEDQVFKAWEGLGYYRRARNLMAAARVVAGQYGGVFPDSFEGLRSLPGVGDYTAAAIASFAYGLPHAVLDGNVQRVLARYFGLQDPVESAPGKRALRAAADAVLDRSDPGAWNQAMMDFGASLCKPRQPRCGDCPVSSSCRALAAGLVEELPRKKTKAARRTRYFHYLVLRQGEQVLVRRREGKDIWEGLYEFPLLETGHAAEPEELLHFAQAREWLKGSGLNLEQVSPWYEQALSHQQIRARFLKFSSRGGKLPEMPGWQASGADELRSLAFPRIIVRYLNDAGE
jgi:A/G-specific adenine glycosylase